jgi:WD40 repeat protein
MKKLSECRGHPTVISQISFSPDGKSLWSAGEDSIIRRWNTATGKQTKMVLVDGHTRKDPYQPGKPSRLQHAAFSPDGRIAVTSGMWDDTLIVWNLKTGKK